MKTKRSICFRNVSAFLVLLLALTATAFTQQFYNYNTGGAANTFPFGTLPATGKTTQTLYLPGEFNNPSAPPAGNITKIYYRAASTGSGTYTSLKIRMGLTTDIDLPPTSWYAGTLTTVLNQSNYVITSTSGSFVSITLDTPFLFDPTKSLVVEIEQCGYSGTGFNVFNTTTSGTKRHTAPLAGTACPHPWGNTGAFIIHTGIDVAAAPTGIFPNLLYYKFENNPNSTTVLNCAVPFVGTPTAPLGVGTPLSTGGQYDSAITGTYLTTGGITTGWNCNLGTSSWTISMWVTIPTTSSGSAFYLFGDAGSGAFRCFHNGVALPDNLVLRGGFTDVTVTGIGPAPTVVTFVYDSAAAQVRAYKNGVLAVTSNQTLNIVTGTGFKVGGYGTTASFGGKMDEFRMWRRALTPAEVTATWNSDLGGCAIVGITPTNNEIPGEYSLSQNYPNPFNPTTNIKFAIPSTGLVKLVIFDVLGREVTTLVNEVKVAGNYTVDFNASSLSSGVYFYRIDAGNFTQTKKMLLIK